MDPPEQSDSLANVGGVLFFDLRDRHGLTQVVIRERATGFQSDPRRIRPEYVIRVVGPVQQRSADTINPKLDTGEIEVAAIELEVLNEAKTPPFPINEDTAVAEETRLKYRYLDLRRPALQRNLCLLYTSDAAD